MRLFRNVIIGVRSFFGRVKSAYDSPRPSISNVSPPFAFLWAKPYALETRLVVTPKRTMHGVLGWCALAKIAASVIKRVAIPMIGLFRISAAENFSVHEHANECLVRLNHIALGNECPFAGRAPIGKPVPLRQPFKICGVNYRVLTFSKRNQAVRWIGRLSNRVAFHAQALAGHVPTSNRNLLLSRHFTLSATILLFCGLSFAQGTELLRPTADQNTGASSWVTTNCGVGSYVATTTSGDLGRDTGGLTTSVNYTVSTSGTFKTTARTWTTWASTSNSYTALILNVSASSSGTVSDLGGTAKVVYSINGGSTWTLLSTPNGIQATTTVALNAGQDLSQLKVAACTSTGNADPGLASNNVRLFDIWTVGTLGSPAAGTGSSSGTAVQPVQFN